MNFETILLKTTTLIALGLSTGCSTGPALDDAAVASDADLVAAGFHLHPLETPVPYPSCTPLGVNPSASTYDDTRVVMDCCASYLTVTQCAGYIVEGGIRRELAITTGQSLVTPLSVNDDATVVGMSWAQTNGSNWAYMEQKEQAIDLNTWLAPGSTWVLTRAVAINNKGHFTGWYQDLASAGGLRSFIYDGTGFSDLGDLGASQVFAADINEHNEVVGVAFDANGHGHGFYWSAATGMIQLADLSSNHVSEATAISNVGTIAGAATTGNWNEPVAWVPLADDRVYSHAIAVGYGQLLSARPAAINTTGYAVGSGSVLSGGAFLNEATLWSPQGNFALLRQLVVNQPNWNAQLGLAYDISEGNVIACTSRANPNYTFSPCVMIPAGGP